MKLQLFGNVFCHGLDKARRMFPYKKKSNKTAAAPVFYPSKDIPDRLLKPMFA